MSPDEYCRQKASQSGSSFYYSFLCLPTEKRQAIMSLYAFCREVDDVVDECSEPALANIKLAWWRQEVDAMESGQPQHPVSIALQASCQRFSLPIELLQEIIDGMLMDLQQSRYPDFKSLSLYCYRVAGTVGLLSAQIFGYTNRQTLKYAHDLGMALQLTNIIRDVGEDARRGRIYLPEEDLVRFGVSESSILEGHYSEAFYALMSFQAERAYRYYTEAWGLLPIEDRKAQVPGLMMAKIYRTLLVEIERLSFDILHQRVTLPPVRKIGLALKTFLIGYD